MTQNSYGTITITDTTDIENIIIEYAQNQDPLNAPSDNWGTTRPQWAEGYYIWQRSRIHKYGTSSSADDIGVAVCITGSQGETGRSLTSTTTQYTTAASSATITTDNMDDYIWYTNIPPYNSSTPVYWVRVTNIYSNPSTGYLDVYSGEVADGSGSSNGNSSSNQNNLENNFTTIYIIYKDEGLTSAVSMSQTALTQSSSNINTIIRLWYRSNSATAPNKPTSHITQSDNNVDNTWTTTKPIDKDGYRYYYYCDELCTGGGAYKWTNVVLDTSNLSQYEIGALTTKVKNFWWNADGAHAASGKGGNEVDKDTISTYGYNSLMGLNGISFGYDNAKVVELNSNTPALNFYSPPTIVNNTITAVGKKIMQLSGTSLTFYNPSNENETYAQLSPTGLLLREGGIQSGSVDVGNNGFIYLSTKDYGIALTIGGGINKTNWRQIIGTKFGVDSEGNLYAANANITGAIVATSLDLTTNNVKIGTGSINGLASVATTGSYSDLSNKPTIPSLTGYIYENGTIGSTPAEGATGFVVSSSGALQASNAIIYGSLYASAGYVGGWRIGTDGNKTLHNGNVDTSPVPGDGVIILSKGITNSTATGLLPANKTWAFTAGNNFGVTTNGILYTNGANITDINANNITSGSINSDVLKTNVVAAINATVDKIDAKNINVDGTLIVGANDVNNAIGAAVNEIEIGGRNLHKNSNLIDSSWTIANGSHDTDEVVTLTRASSETRIYQMPAYGYWEWQPNTTYTASIDVKGDSGGEQFEFSCNGGGTVTYISGRVNTVTTSWTRYKCTFTTSGSVTTGSMTYQLTSNNSTIQVRLPKLESGNKATDWSPAPEDTISGIASAKAQYGICSTAAATAAKTATISGFQLYDGAIVAIRFTNGNSVTSNVTLNISGTGAKGVIVTGSSSRFATLEAYAVVSFVYDSASNYWRQIDDAGWLVKYYNRYCVVGNSSNTQTNLWRKFASYTSTATYHDPYIVLDVITVGDMNDTRKHGRLKAHLRTGSTVGTVDTSHISLEWLTRADGIILTDFVLAYKATSGTSVIIELWCRCPSSWLGYKFSMVEEGARTAFPTSNMWTLYNDYTADGVASITAGYTQVTSTDIDNARKTATNYITYIDSTNGIKIHDANDSTDYLQINASKIALYRNNTEKMQLTDSNFRLGDTSDYVNIDSSGIQFYKGGNSTASFGNTIRIGSEAGKNVYLDSNGMYIREATSNKSYFKDKAVWLGIDPGQSSSSKNPPRKFYDMDVVMGAITIPPSTTYPSGGWAIMSKLSTELIEYLDDENNTDHYEEITTLSNGIYVNEEATIELIPGSGAYYSRLTLESNKSEWYHSALKVDARLISFTHTMDLRVNDYNIVNTGNNYSALNDLYYSGSGYLTSSNTQILITIPMDRPIAASTVSIPNSPTLITRQNNAYTHGSSASTRVAWTVSSATVTRAGIKLTLTRSTTTNSINNSPIGVDIYIQRIDFD